MDKEKLAITLKLHEMWLIDPTKGSRADLRGADLQHADLQHADLRRACLQDTILQDTDLQYADLRHADLRCTCLWHADLRDADLQHADLWDADLKGADIDYACLPLWCGSLRAQFDDRQLRQIAYHLVRAGLYSKNASAETKAELSKLIDFANQFHRVQECGKITIEKGE